MKIQLFFLKQKATQVFLFFLMLFSMSALAQTNLVTYPFTGNTLIGGRTYEATLQTTPPTITYSNPPASLANDRLKAKNIGEYIEITIDTRSFSNISLDFDSFYKFTGALGFGTWNVTYDTGSGFQNLSGITLADTAIFDSGENSGHYSDTLPATANNTQYLKIRITSADFPIFGTSTLNIDNIKISAGNAIIDVFNSSNATIPHQSLASYLYDTDFGTILTSAGSTAKVYTIKNTGSIALTISSITSTGQDPADFVVTNVPTSVPVGGNRTFTVTFDPTNDGVRTADIQINSNSAPNPYIFNVQGRGVSCALVPSAFQLNGFGVGTPTLTTSATPATASGNSGALYFPNNSKMFAPSDNASDKKSWIINNSASQLEFGPVPLAGEKNVSINFYVAAFSTDGNGVNGRSTIKLSVWNPIINDWSEEMILVGTDGNNKYRYYQFPPDEKTGLFEVEYDGDKVAASKFNAGASGNLNSKISNFKLKIPETYGNSLKFKIEAKTNRAQDFWLIDEVRVNTENTVTKTWTVGNAWSPSAPTENEKAIIEGQYTNAGNQTICECEVKDGGSLTIPQNTSVTVKGKIINKGDGTNFIVKDGGNLIQIEDGAVNTGNITAQKVFTFTNNPIKPANDRKQYNYVISPVVGQNIKTIYDGNSVVIAYKESTNFFVNSDGNYVPGKGYGVKEPSKAAVPTSTVTAKYVGVPYNGTLNYSLEFTPDLIDADQGYNLVGNPYPSNIDIDKLYAANSAKIDATFYFWDNRGNTIFAQEGSGYEGDNYAKYNAASHTGTSIGTVFGTERTPTKDVKVGTGFLVQAKTTANGQTLDYNNAMRSADNSGPGFFGKGDEVRDRFWLRLKTPSEIEFMNAVVYFANGSKAFGEEDTETFGGSDDIFTIVDDKKLAIQGRDLFTDTDEVDLGLSLFRSGEHVISIYDKEGVFANGQSIYLKDRETGIITNLSEGSYAFTANAGQYSGRFQILYRPETTLATDAAVKDDLLVYRDGDDFVVKSKAKKITNLQVYDMNGRLIITLQPNSTKTLISASQLLKGMYILKISQGDIVTGRKIIK